MLLKYDTAFENRVRQDYDKRKLWERSLTWCRMQPGRYERRCKIDCYKNELKSTYSALWMLFSAGITVIASNLYCIRGISANHFFLVILHAQVGINGRFLKSSVVSLPKGTSHVRFWCHSGRKKWQLDNEPLRTLLQRASTFCTVSLFCIILANNSIH
jgi:tRNA(His) 5'-end guanylyltransferase